VIDGLRERGLADDTLLVITGDHGEGLNCSHESLGHGFRIYQENTNVPCIFWNPRLFSHAGRNHTIGSHLDLCPTITGLLGIQPAGTWQGHDLFDPARPSRAYFYGAHNDLLLGVREQNWKYIYNATTGYDELYDLGTDPTEHCDVSSTQPEVCQALQRRAAAWARHLDRCGPGVPPR
jgi:arylsulfatase A-like enzyme